MIEANWSLRGPRWSGLAAHQEWLRERARVLLDFYDAAVNPDGGFYDLDETRRPLPTGWPPASHLQTSLFQTTRMVHSYGIAHLWGRPGSDWILDHGMAHLWDVHRDTQYGGYYWVCGVNGPLDATKQAYGHAFVLLAASTAKVAGHPDADRLIADVSEVIDVRFWEPSAGAIREEFTRDWSGSEEYRGANSNMHLTEALLAAHEATRESEYLDRAYLVAERIIGLSFMANEWRVPEHFHADWSINLNYDRDVFRPYGSTIGHWMEWSRLLMQLWVARGRSDDWLRDAATRLFDSAFREGWDRERGGFYFTVDWKGRPANRDRYWWPVTEGIAAAHWLLQLDGDNRFEEAYRILWSWACRHLVAPEGYWRHQLDDTLRPISDPWFGAPDLYHALHATLIPTLPATAGLAHLLASASPPTENHTYPYPTNE